MAGAGNNKRFLDGRRGSWVTIRIDIDASTLRNRHSILKAHNNRKDMVRFEK
jgi:hypothetical protein